MVFWPAWCQAQGYPVVLFYSLIGDFLKSIVEQWACPMSSFKKQKSRDLHDWPLINAVDFWSKVKMNLESM